MTGRHYLIGLGSPLAAFGFRLAHRVLLGRSRSLRVLTRGPASRLAYPVGYLRFRCRSVSRLLV